MFKYSPTVEEIVDAYTVAYGSEGSQKLVNTLVSFLSDIDVENVYGRALHKVREDMSQLEAN